LGWENPMRGWPRPYSFWESTETRALGVRRRGEHYGIPCQSL